MSQIDKMEIHNSFRLIQNQAEEATRACEQGLEGERLPKNVANHLIGIAAYIKAVAEEIKRAYDQ